MNQKLVDVFNLPKEEATSPIVEEEIVKVEQETLTNLEKLDRALPGVIGLDKTDKELDEIKDLAVNSYRDLMDLGLQTDPRYSAEIFATAASFMGHALSSTEAKINKKLKMIDLQLKKASLDHKISQTETEIQALPSGTGQALDRNELLKIIRGSDKT